VKQGQVDVTDKEGMAKFLLAVDKATPVECVCVPRRCSALQRPCVAVWRRGAAHAAADAVARRAAAAA
jgi:hypothetical protein